MKNLPRGVDEVDYRRYFGIPSLAEDGPTKSLERLNMLTKHLAPDSAVAAVVKEVHDEIVNIATNIEISAGQNDARQAQLDSLVENHEAELRAAVEKECDELYASFAPHLPPKEKFLVD